MVMAIGIMVAVGALGFRGGLETGSA